MASEHKEKMMIERGKAVLQWENNIPIALYPSLKEAGRRTGISWSNIRNVCNGEYKTAGGYEWSYACKPYDIDKVVEQLEECSVNYCKEYGYAEDENVLYLPDAIEIVKGGLDESRNDSTSRQPHKEMVKRTPRLSNHGATVRKVRTAL